MQVGPSSPAQSPPLASKPGQADSSRLQERKADSSSDAERGPTTASDRIAERRELQGLKNRDRAVRAHELAHQSVGARYITRGAQFQYETGPDGRQYAVSGDVSIDTSAVPGDPQATLEKARTIQRAALAPVDPSPTDRQVAAKASAMIQQARIELALQVSDNRQNPGGMIDSFA